MSGLWRMTDIQLSEIAKGLQKLETTAKFEFAQQPSLVQSPEDRPTDKLQKSSLISICRCFDFFYDVVFQLEGHALIKANTAVLIARSEYFKIMFSKDYCFTESSGPSDKSLKLLNQNFEP
jgi:hypothetical protein